MIFAELQICCEKEEERIWQILMFILARQEEQKRQLMFWPIGNEVCGGCGLCAKECPAGAINPADPKQTNKELCICCMRCVSVCPKQARSCDREFMETMAEKMAPVLSGRKENYLFWENHTFHCNEDLLLIE